MAGQIDLEGLWQKVNQALRRGPVNRSLWEAADAAVPLTIENDTLVLGFEPKDMRHASYIETTVNKTRVQEVLQARTGKRLDVRCIEGATLEAWTNVKIREAHGDAKAEDQFEEFRAHGASLKAWQDLINALQKLYADTPNRRWSIVQAQLLVRALPMVYDTDTRLRAEDADAGSLHDQQLNRVWDRLSTVCEMPASLVALEYLRYKGARKK